MIDDTEISEEMLEARRRRLEFEALGAGLALLRTPGASQTALAAVIRVGLSNATARRHDDGFEKEPERMSRDEISVAIRKSQLRLASLDAIAAEVGAEEVEFEEVAPAGADVFD